MRKSRQWGKVAGISGRDIAQAFASSAATAFTSFINKVAAGRNVFKSLGQSVAQFAASFISAIAQALVQLLAFAAAVQVLRALGVPIPSGVGVGLHHTGGIAGEAAGGVRRNVPETLFATAMRFHTGGIAGLAPDEVPAILRRQEEVLTTSDPRHRFDGGLSGGAAPRAGDVHVINLFDPDQVANRVLRTPAGAKAILNMVSENPRAFKAALG